MRLSRISRIALPVLAAGLVLHSLIIAYMFGARGMDADSARILAAWKEIALGVMLIALVIRAVTRHVRPTSVTGTDLIVGSLVFTAIIYLIAPNVFLGEHVGWTTQLLGFRDAVFFMLLYFIGRSTADLVDNDYFARVVFWISVGVCLAGVLERFLVSPETLVALGVASYFQNFLGVAEFTAGNEYGLPMNYWTRIGRFDVPRAGSVFLSAQGFAVPLLILFPITMTWVFRDRKKGWQVAAFCIVVAGLLLTLTRMTIIAVGVQVVLFLTLTRRPVWAAIGAAIAVPLFVIGIVFVPGVGGFLWNTIAFQESSAAGHADNWARGIAAFFQQPWGWGLGTTDQTAVRAGLIPITGDNMYLKYAVEMGVLGIGLFLAMLTSFARSGINLFRSAAPPAQRRIGMAVFLATIGIAMNGMTAMAFNSVPLAWFYFWAAGAVVTSSEATRRALPRPIPEPSPS